MSSIPPKKQPSIKQLSPDSIAAKRGWKLATSEDSTEAITPRAARQPKKEKLAEKSITSRSVASDGISSTETTTADTKPTISELKAQLEQQRGEIEHLNNIIDEAAEEALEHNKLQTNYQDLKTKFDEFNETLMQKLEKAIESNEYAYSDIEIYKNLAAEKVSQVEDLKNESTKLEKELKESIKTITNLKNDSDKLKNQIETLKTTNADLSKKNRSYIAEQEAAAKKQMKEIGKIVEKKPILKNIAREKELEQQNKDLHQELKNTNQDLEELQQFRLADEKLNKSLKKENFNLTNKSKKLTAQNAKQTDEIKKLKAEIEKLRAGK